MIDLRERRYPQSSMPASRIPPLIDTALRATAWLLAAAWTAKAISVARGLRRVPNLLDPAHDCDPDPTPAGNQPAVTVIVPARNEAAAIEACLSSLLAQTYLPLRILAINDRSTDSTGAVMDTLAAQHPDRLSVLHVTTLPAGWLGKTHAMAFAARHTLSLHHPDWLLFTDGDVLFHPDALRRSLALATHQQADHFVTLPTPLLRSPGEAMLLGCFQVLGFWAVRAWRIADPRTRDAVGVGAFNLLRTSAYRQLGGFEALRYQIVEDLALGRRVHRLGLRQRVVFAPGYVSLHWAPGIKGILGTMTKNLFAIFGYRLVLLSLGCAGLLVLCVGPFAALGFRFTRIPGAIAALAIITIYRTASPLTRVPARYALGFPIATILLVFACLRSAAVTLRAGGVTWRGTFYPLPELRAKAEQL